MNSATRTLIALAAGLALGAAVKWSGVPWLLGLARDTAPIGALWLSALKMTLVPLIFALVASGVGAWGGAGRGGRVLGGVFALFAGLMCVGAVTGGAAMSGFLRLWPTAPGALAFLTQGAPAGPHPATPSITDQIVALIPTNPVAAAADGAMTPLIVFALLFGLALTRIGAQRRRVVQEVLNGIGETMMVLVQWVLTLAPLGVFVLSLGMAVNAGVQAAGVLIQEMILSCTLATIGIGLSYLVARFGGAVGFARFAAAAIGPQAVAAGTTSSMATLPAMIEAAEDQLACPPALAGAFLPLAVSTFRFGTVMMIMGTAVFAATAAGHPPGVAQMAVAAFVAVLTTIGVMGLPAAAVLYAADAPAFQVLGAPLELLPLLIAIFSIPDVFVTVSNVTADLAATTVAQRFAGRRVSAAPVSDGAVVLLSVETVTEVETASTAT